jgi:hypothetical protein
MFHADVVIMVCKGLAGGGIRTVFSPDSEGRSYGYKVFNDGPRSPDTEWPRRPEGYAYRKRWDGRVEFIDSTGSVYEWLPEIGYQD